VSYKEAPSSLSIYVFNGGYSQKPLIKSCLISELPIR